MSKYGAQKCKAKIDGKIYTFPSLAELFLSLNRKREERRDIQSHPTT